MLSLIIAKLIFPKYLHLLYFICHLCTSHDAATARGWSRKLHPGEASLNRQQLIELRRQLGIMSRIHGTFAFNVTVGFRPEAGRSFLLGESILLNTIPWIAKCWLFFIESGHLQDKRVTLWQSSRWMLCSKLRLWSKLSACLRLQSLDKSPSLVKNAFSESWLPAGCLTSFSTPRGLFLNPLKSKSREENRKEKS